jgi:hypothetical protein
MSTCAATAAILALGAVHLPSTFAADAPADLAPYIGKTCTSKVGNGRNEDVIVLNADGTVASHHKYTTESRFVHDGGLRPLTKGADGWWHFTSDSGSEQAYLPKDATSLSVRIKIPGKGGEYSVVYDCSP